ncbi:MAG: sugar phosphate isomerase/epimerase [Deltaproteobacteria bacterium]|nr:sugar phosphate isomerase/epimerase [Deltaproteobacteria bacterium]
MMTSRREFLAVAGAASEIGAPSARRRGHPELALATICIEGFGPTNFAKTFKAAPLLGMNNIEFNLWHADQLTPHSVKRIKAICDRQKLRPISLQVNAFVGADEPEIAREVSRWLWLIEICKAWGCSLIKATGEARGTRGGTAGIMNVLAQVLPAAQAAHVRIALENHFENNIEFPEDFEAFFSALPHSSLGMCLDMAHFVASGVDPVPLIQRFGRKIFHVDVKDCDGPGRHHVTPYGKGLVPLQAMLQGLRDAGYQGFWVIEYARAAGDVPLAELAEGIHIARSYL